MSSVSLLTAVPHFVSKEESDSLSASTPSSFSDIPPVLIHKEDNVSVTLDPPLAVDRFTEQDAAHGTLYVLSSVLVFMSATGRGFKIDYPSITLHAISRAGDRPSIYCQLDEETTAAAEQLSHTNLNGTVAGDEGDGERDEEQEQEPEQDYSPMRELNIFPQNPQSLDDIFEALSKCASLHPDDHESDDENDAFFETDGANFEVFNGDEEQELSEVGRAALDHLESIIYNPYERDNVEEAEKSEGQPPQASEEGSGSIGSKA